MKPLTPERMERAAGALVLVVALLVVGAVLLNLRQRGYFEPVIRVHAFHASASGFSAGKALTFRGREVGSIAAVELDTERLGAREPKPVRIDIHIKKRYGEFIRNDYLLSASLGSAITGALLGGGLEIVEPDPRKTGTGGEKPAGRPIEDGDVLAFAESGMDFNLLLEQVTAWWESNREWLEKMPKDVASTLSNVAGVTGALEDEEAGVPALLVKANSIAAHVDGLVGQLERGEGTAGAFLSDPKVKEEFVAILESTRGLAAELAPLLASVRETVARALPPILDSAASISQDVAVITHSVADRPERISGLLDSIVAILDQLRRAIETLVPVIEREAPDMVGSVRASLDDAQAMVEGLRRLSEKLGVAEPPPSRVEPELRQPREGGRP